MPLFSASDIIGKTLIAKNRIPIFRSRNDIKPFAFINAGQPVGIVYSYLAPNYDHPNLWWMFKSNNKIYYAEHKEGNFDISALKNQGVISTDEKTKIEKSKQEKQEKGAVSFYIEKYVPYIILGIFAVPIIKDLIKK
jgi:hypothetical protein